MGRMKAIAERMQREEQQTAEPEVNWADLCKRINEGQVIPIVGNGVMNELLFPMSEEDLAEIEPGRENPLGWSIEEYHSVTWATKIAYPLPESHVLPRVALFDRVVNSDDDRQAKTRYFDWLKSFLLIQAEVDGGGDPDRLAELRDEMGNHTVSYLAAELGYPRRDGDTPNTLDLLARLNLPIYVTTSPFDLLERAIAGHGRRPRTQVCFWRGAEPLRWADAGHKTDYAFTPSVAEPLVYHMFGLEAYPESVVLSEDDYLDFLTAIAKDTSPTRPIVPLYLRQAITQSTLILMGYRLRDADFRVVFRGLINATPSSLRPYSLAIQVDPRQRSSIVSTETLIKYLTVYFKEAKFHIAWQSPADFAAALWKEFNEWRR